MDSFGSSGPPAGPASGGERVFSMCRALSKTWFLKETVTLLKLALPVVSVSCCGAGWSPRPSASKIKPPAVTNLLHHLQLLMNVLKQTPHFFTLLFVGKFGSTTELNAVGMVTNQ